MAGLDNWLPSGRLIDEMRSGADVETRPGELDNKQITRLHQLLHEAKFKEPDGSHLSPAGCPPVCQCFLSCMPSPLLSPQSYRCLTACFSVSTIQSPPSSWAWALRRFCCHIEGPNAIIILISAHVTECTKSCHSYNSDACRCTGEYNLRLGIMKELNPDMVATHQGTAPPSQRDF